MPKIKIWQVVDYISCGENYDKHREIMTKIVAELEIDEGWVDHPEIDYASYVFDNMLDCINYFNELGQVEVIKFPNIQDLYDFGILELKTLKSNFQLKLIFNCKYARS